MEEGSPLPIEAGAAPDVLPDGLAVLRLLFTVFERQGFHLERMRVYDEQFVIFNQRRLKQLLHQTQPQSLHCEFPSIVLGQFEGCRANIEGFQFLDVVCESLVFCFGSDLKEKTYLIKLSNQDEISLLTSSTSKVSSLNMELSKAVFCSFSSSNRVSRTSSRLSMSSRSKSENYKEYFNFSGL